MVTPRGSKDAIYKAIGKTKYMAAKVIGTIGNKLKEMKDYRAVGSPHQKEVEKRYNQGIRF